MGIDDEWNDDEPRTIQRLAIFLNIELFGFSPTPESGPDKPEDFPYVPDLNIELFQRNNGVLAQLVVLSALLKTSADRKQSILSSLDPGGFWSRSFGRYLFDTMRNEYSTNGRIEASRIQTKIPEYVPTVYGEEPSPRTLFGNYYNWAMILRLQPTWRQILRAIEILNDQAIAGQPS